jgi:hypothetical protein
MSLSENKKRRTIPNLYSTDHLLLKTSTVENYKYEKEKQKKELNTFSDKNLGRAGFYTNQYNNAIT